MEKVKLNNLKGKKMLLNNPTYLFITKNFFIGILKDENNVLP